MAQQQTEQKTAGNGNGKTTPPAGPPAGFRRVGALDDCPWFVTEMGAVLHGRVEGVFAMRPKNDKARLYYQVTTAAPCKGRVGKGDDAKLIDVPVGTVVNLSEAFKMQPLRDEVGAKIQAGAIIDIWVQAGKKIPLTGGKKMQMFDTRVNVLKGPTSKVEPFYMEGITAETEESANDTENGTPF